MQELIKKTHERQSASLSEISWSGRSVAVKNEQIRELLLNIEHNAVQLDETTSDEHKLSLYESMMKALVEAQQILRDDYKDDPVSFVTFCPLHAQVHQWTLSDIRQLLVGK